MKGLCLCSRASVAAPATACDRAQKALSQGPRGKIMNALVAYKSINEERDK